MEFGAGRRGVTDVVDYASGLLLQKKQGDRLSASEILTSSFCNKKEPWEDKKNRIQKAIKIVDPKTEPEPLIYSFMDSSGEKNWDAELRIGF